MSDEFADVVARVRERVEPDADERERLGQVVATLRDRIQAAVADLPIDAETVEVVQVGSTARDTWLSGTRDVDLFVCFPPDVSREELERYGLEVGHAVLPDGHEEYAEHPYVNGEYDGFAVDLVPCYAVDDPTAIKSAVDRTPFHTRYLTERIDSDLASEIRVTKQFLTGIGVYGSDLRTKGFSGYLTELLLVEYGSFRAFLETAADWHPQVRIDPEDHGRPETDSPSRNDEVGSADLAFDDPLVVVDPTDPERNVAAVCSAESVARLQHYARELLADPRDDLFDADEREPLSPSTVRQRFAERGTTPVALRFDAPDVVDDQLYPQLERSRDGLVGELDRRGFDVFRSAAFADGTAVLLAELAVAERPTIERHEGPPVHVREHARSFYQTYAGANEDTDGDGDGASDEDGDSGGLIDEDGDSGGPINEDGGESDERTRVYGPYIDGDRYVVEREREFATAAGFLASDAVFDVALGARVEEALRADYEVLVGDDVGELATEFGAELAAYLDPRP